MGALSPEDAHLKIRDAELIFTPSLYDNFPYTVIESMELGKIVISSDSGGMREVIRSGYNGFLFSISNYDSFKKSFDNFLCLSDNQKKDMEINAAYSIKKICSYNTIYTKKIKLFNNIIYN